MDWAVIKFSGKQYLVKVGTKIQVNGLAQKVGKEIKFDQVLLVANERVKIGKPTITDFKVRGKVVRKFAGPKFTVTKFKPKSRYLRRTGTRAKFVEIEIVGANT